MSLRFMMSAIVVESTVNCVLEIFGGKMFVVRVSKVINHDQVDSPLVKG